MTTPDDDPATCGHRKEYGRGSGLWTVCTLAADHRPDNHEGPIPESIPDAGPFGPHPGHIVTWKSDELELNERAVRAARAFVRAWIVTGSATSLESTEAYGKMVVALDAAAEKEDEI